MASRTGSGLNRFWVALVAFCCVAAVARAGAESAMLRGTFALLGGTPKIVSDLREVPGKNATAMLKIRQFIPGSTSPIVNYAVDMQKVMHLVVVRDDFATFEHLHPSFDTTTGTFSQAVSKQPNHRYYVYADSEPQGIGQQVFRFTLPSVGPVTSEIAKLVPSASSVASGPYVVTLATTTLRAEQPQSLDLTITKNGRPAQDLGTYLGAAAHVVFINTSTLAYVHVHPHVRGETAAPMTAGNNMHMEMAAEAGPNMKMELPSLSASPYKVWIQFRGANDKLYTAPFTVLVR